MNTLVKIDDAIGLVLKYICFALFMAIVIIGGIQVIGRYVFNNTIFWGEEMMRFCCIWLTMMGSAVAVRTDHHVAVDLLQESIHNPKAKAILFAITRGLCIVFILILFKPAVDLVLKSTHSMAATIRLPFAWVYLSCPVGFLLMLISYVRVIITGYNKLSAGEAIHEVGDKD